MTPTPLYTSLVQETHYDQRAGAVKGLGCFGQARCGAASLACGGSSAGSPAGRAAPAARQAAIGCSCTYRGDGTQRSPLQRGLQLSLLCRRPWLQVCSKSCVSNRLSLNLCIHGPGKQQLAAAARAEAMALSAALQRGLQLGLLCWQPWPQVCSKPCVCEHAVFVLRHPAPGKQQLAAAARAEAMVLSTHFRSVACSSVFSAGSFGPRCAASPMLACGQCETMGGCCLLYRSVSRTHCTFPPGLAGPRFTKFCLSCHLLYLKAALHAGSIGQAAQSLQPLTCKAPHKRRPPSLHAASAGKPVQHAALLTPSAAPVHAGSMVWENKTDSPHPARPPTGPLSRCSWRQIAGAACSPADSMSSPCACRQHRPGRAKQTVLSLQRAPHAQGPFPFAAASGTRQLAQRAALLTPQTAPLCMQAASARENSGLSSACKALHTRRIPFPLQLHLAPESWCSMQPC